MRPLWTALAATLRETLSTIPGVELRDLGRRKCGIVTFTKQGAEPQAIADALGAQRMNISVSRVTSSQLDLGPRGLSSVARASVHYFNTEDEIHRFAAAVRAV